MRVLRIAGKYLDQPKLVSEFADKVPLLLTTGMGLYGAKQVCDAPKGKKKNTAIRLMSVLSLTGASALLLRRKPDFDKVKQAALIDDFVKTADKKLVSKIGNALEKAKNKILSPNDIKLLDQNLSQTKEGKKFFNKLIPEPENITSKEIFKEIKWLSLMGLMPVVGGVSGGIIGDALTERNWKKKLPDKIKEGAYQFLANIFLCNVGAGAALGIMEKFNIKSKSARAAGMITGIIPTGITGGNCIANFIGKKCIDPLFKNSSASGRKPEALDVGLHVDDIATVAVLSGLKWIEPALPILYSISGYRAGIGYRNVPNCDKDKHHVSENHNTIQKTDKRDIHVYTRSTKYK